MGAGRKTKTLPPKEKADQEWTINSSVSAKNLRKSELGSVIFGCRHSTMKECKEKNLFGLPFGHFSYVKNVTPGLVLFLFNYSDRKLHGIFEAISPGQLNINPYAWTGGRTQCTAFPAQVRVRVQHPCRPLFEEEFAPIIADNYYEANHFWFELDCTQTRKLIDLFLASPPISRFGHHSQNTFPDSKEIKSSVSEDITNIPHEVDEECETWEEVAANVKPKVVCSYAPAVNDTTNSLPQKSWNSLFKAPPQAPPQPPTPSAPQAPLEASVYNDDREINNDLGMSFADSGGQAFDFQLVLCKLMQEVEELKASQRRQDMKIRSLEQELARSQMETQTLSKFFE